MIPTSSHQELCDGDWALSSIQGGVQIFFPPEQTRNLCECLSFSDGTVRAALNPRLAGLGFSEDAIVPTPRWREPEPEELSLLVSDCWSHRDQMVGVLRLYDPEEIRAIQSELDLVERHQETSELNLEDPFISELLLTIGRFCDVDGPISYHRIKKDTVDLDTVSFDDELASYVGLHVDSWTEGDNYGHKGTRNRICLNLGPDDRFFLFVNQDVTAMIKLLGLPSDQLQAVSKSDLGKKFLATFPRYPVIKVKLEPGEAYLAPTTHLLHDGSSLNVTIPVKHTAFRGYFDIR